MILFLTRLNETKTKYGMPLISVCKGRFHCVYTFKVSMDYNMNTNIIVT